MSAVAAGSSTKVAKASKVNEAKPPPSHPTYSAVIKKAVSELNEKARSSMAAILKFVLSHYKLGDNITKISSHLRIALKEAVVKGELKDVTGAGHLEASGLVQRGIPNGKRRPGAGRMPKFPTLSAKKLVSKAVKPKANKPKASDSETKKLKA